MDGWTDQCMEGRKKGKKDEGKELKGSETGRERRIMKEDKGIERKGEQKEKKDNGSIFHKPYLLLALSTFPALFLPSVLCYFLLHHLQKVKTVGFCKFPYSVTKCGITQIQPQYSFIDDLSNQET